MRIQFVRVPPVDNFGATPEKIFMCISEVANKGKWSEAAATLKAGLGVDGVLVTDEVVHFEPAQPEPEPVLPGRLWDAAVAEGPEVRWFCHRVNCAVEYTNITPHGPCLYVSCAREHCRCEHSDPFKPEPEPEGEAVHRCNYCLARPGNKWVLSEACDHA